MLKPNTQTGLILRKDKSMNITIKLTDEEYAHLSTLKETPEESIKLLIQSSMISKQYDNLGESCKTCADGDDEGWCYSGGEPGRESAQICGSYRMCLDLKEKLKIINRKFSSLL